MKGELNMSNNKKIINLATEKFVNDTIDYKAFDVLQTSDKTIIGAIHELFSTMTDISPELTLKAQMFYGVIPGPIESFRDITLEMLNNTTSVISTRPGERQPLPLGNVSEGSFIVVAVPALFNFVVTKDNGFGGKVAFDESIIGANGIDVKFDDIPYRLYGEFVLVSGNRQIYIANPPSSGGDCNCPDITIRDIDDIMEETFGED
jgi:hypothetical protein